MGIRILEFCRRKNRKIDAAVLNVGISLGGAFLENKLEDELRLIDINISGTVHMAKRVAHHMAKTSRGYITCFITFCYTANTI